MANTHNSPAKPIESPIKKPQMKKNKNKKKMKKMEKTPLPPPQPPKRTKAPGVRVVGGRIYDSENGQTCHQCRQKTRDFVAACKNQGNEKSCTIKFCHKCLLNRYGEKAEEMMLLDDWICPKCRGICNCSFCMKKRGHNPTGILVHTAKKTGYSSVSEMLHINGSPKKSTTSNQGLLLDLNELPIDESDNSNLEVMTPSSGSDGDNKIIKRRLKESEQKNSSDGNKKMKKHILKESELKNSSDGDKKIKKRRLKESKQKNSEEDNACEESKIAVAISLPKGIEIRTVAGIDLAAEDVGPALQFLEFCKAFGQVLNLKEDHPESVLRELTRGCSRNRRQYSSATEFHTMLLSLIQKDIGEESALSPTSSGSSWLQALGGCISESQCALREIPSGCFVRDGIEYETLDPSKKLKILNWLCDEALRTKDLRDWIDQQKSILIAQEKQAKEKVTAAKDKEKHMKQKLQNEVAKAILKNEAPLSISEHDDLVESIKTQAAEAHAEALEAENVVPKRKQRSDAVRTDPTFLDENGNKFWRLGSYSDEPNILLQEFGTWDSGIPEDKWLAYTAEQKKEVESCISSLRRKRLRIQEVANKLDSSVNYET
ncbi:hypothetical protein GIB67_036287 [Kingdonia uniflora]|uniref:DDT domain-containing protein n=1 Tax=Kingdonia uniflora TaxID=39325 RepID=A0A7J7L3N4_9MAGN|nr:hypothetical protein GIB67_036287 [Kingdonia uniflora]